MKTFEGNLIIKENDTRDFSKLEKVTGYLYVHSNVTLNVKFLNKINYIVADCKVFRNIF